MVRSKPKREKPEETTEEFARRINQKSGKAQRAKEALCVAKAATLKLSLKPLTAQRVSQRANL